MKKVAILFVMMFAGVTMFAQTNVTTVDQHGDLNSVDVLQENEDGPNKLFFTQTGTSNELDAVQKIIEDGSGTTAAYNYSDGKQSGFRNKADVMQDGHTNRSYLLQTGDENEMDLHQTYSQSYVPGGNPPPDMDISDNYAEATQSGDKNDYTMIQEGFTNREKLVQSGDYNTATEDQIAWSSVNKSWKYQIGNHNTSDLDQLGLPYVESDQISYSYTKQKGDDNTANITQIGRYIDNTSDILQTGDDNDARLFQTTKSLMNTQISTNTETGDRNFIKIIQANYDHATDPWWL